MADDEDDDDIDLDDFQRRMNGAISVLRSEFGGLRSGRASTSLLEPIVVEAYGAPMPMNQVGSVSAPEPRMLTVQVWDKANVQAVEKAVREAGLGLNPASDGQLVRVPLPELTEERRQEMAKIAGKYAEQARISVRHVRMDGMNKLKRAEKDGDMSEDDHHLYSDEIQDMTDKMIAEIDQAFATKEQEIMQV
jgi:ribosome recycling factor